MLRFVIKLRLLVIPIVSGKKNVTGLRFIIAVNWNNQSITAAGDYQRL